MPKVAVIMGSTSDYDIMKVAIETLGNFGINVVSRVISAHRTPDVVIEFSKGAKEEGIEAIIAGAGLSAHLPGMVASLTDLPVIGVPIAGKNLGGIDSLLSMVQMPPGIPVATVGIGNAKNAALLAIRILSLKYPYLEEKMKAFLEEQRKKVLDARIPG